MDSSILKSLCQAKQEKHINNKKRNINLVQHLWLAHKQNESMEDMKWCVRHDGNWRRINKDLITINYALEKSKQESWRRGTWCDGEGQVDV
jgi:hypothetical protein